MQEKDPVSALGDALALVTGDTGLPPAYLRDVFGRHMGIHDSHQAAAFIARLDDPGFAAEIKRAADSVHPTITEKLPIERVTGHVTTLLRRAFLDDPELSPAATPPGLPRAELLHGVG